MVYIYIYCVYTRWRYMNIFDYGLSFQPEQWSKMDGSMVFFFDVSTLKKHQSWGPWGPSNASIWIYSHRLGGVWAKKSWRSSEKLWFQDAKLNWPDIYIYYDCICAYSGFLFIAIKISCQIYNTYNIFIYIYPLVI